MESAFFIKKSLLIANPKYEYIYCLNTLGNIEKWKNDTIKTIHNYHKQIIGLSISADRKTMAAFSNNIVIMWRRDGIQQYFDFSNTFEKPISNVFFTPNDQEIIIQGENLFRYNITKLEFLPKTINLCDSCLVAVSAICD